MREAWTFLTRLKDQWVVVLTSTVLALVPSFFDRSVRPLSNRAFWILVALGLFWACFRVWRVESQERLRLGQELDALKAQLLRDAPAVVVEYPGPKGGPDGQYPVLRNVSGAPAFNVCVAPITLGERRAEFDAVPALPAGTSVQVRPYIHNVGAPFFDKLHSAIEFPFKQSPFGSVEAKVPLPFEVSFVGQAGHAFVMKTTVHYSCTLSKSLETVVGPLERRRTSG